MAKRERGREGGERRHTHTHRGDFCTEADFTLNHTVVTLNECLVQSEIAATFVKLLPRHGPLTVGTSYELSKFSP